MVRFAHARTFSNPKLAEAQKDDEQLRRFDPDPKKHSIAVMRASGNPAAITNVSSITLRFNLTGRTGKPLDFYIFCTALNRNNKFFPEFKADACLEIFDPIVFGDRLHQVCRQKFQNCDFYGKPVAYFDSTQLPRTTEQSELIFMKESGYCWQTEFRIIFAISPDLSGPDEIFFELGPLNDICRFI
ncbi:MAG: hypothetical protein H8M99_01845 [Gloeobacteraceae cyanobacterium ES-bin-144]|nr:hypothetical protein [Verrucomicrobiales bacterium]